MPRRFDSVTVVVTTLVRFQSSASYWGVAKRLTRQTLTLVFGGSNPSSPAKFTWQGGVGELLGALRRSEYWGLVQLVERQILTLEVKGSSPLPPAKLIADNGVMFLIGRCPRNAKMCRTYELPKVRALWMETMS